MMFAAVALIPVVGFEISALLLGVALIVPAQHDAFNRKGWISLILGVVATIAAVMLLFRRVLGLPLP